MAHCKPCPTGVDARKPKSGRPGETLRVAGRAPADQSHLSHGAQEESDIALSLSFLDMMAWIRR
jgi:hypothetical protein